MSLCSRNCCQGFLRNVCLSWDWNSGWGEPPYRGEWADSHCKNAHGKEKAAGKCPWVLKTDQGHGVAGKPRFWRSALAWQGSPGQGGGQGGVGLS